MSSLSAMQESYLQGLRQITGQKKVSAAPERLGLGSRPKAPQGKEYAHFNRRDRISTAMSVSNFALLASLFFWILICCGVYILGGYGLMALRVAWHESDISEACSVGFSKDPHINAEVVMNYPKGDVGPYIARLKSEHTDITDYPTDSTHLPPLVTAANSGQYYLLQGLIQHVHVDLKPEHPDLKLIIYDLGLYRREREILEQYCDCEVRTLDYNLFPDHVAALENFAWRPVVIQTLLEEFGAVMYADVTTRFKSANSLNFVRARGRHDFLLWDAVAFTSVVAYTNEATFHFFNESRCPYLEAGVIDSQLMVLYQTNRTWHQVMKPWLKCVLSVGCLAPRWSRWGGCLHFRRPKTTGCHRYDLSALSIVVNRLQQLTLTTSSRRDAPPRITYFSDDEPALFVEQPWTNMQIYILFVIPCLLLVLIFRRPVLRCLRGSIVK